MRTKVKRIKLEIDLAIAERLRQIKRYDLLRDSGELHYLNLATAIGVAEFTLWTWRQKKNKPSAFFLGRIAKVLSLSLPKTMKLMGVETI